MTEGLGLPFGAEEAVDLYGGPGGWDIAAETLGIRPLGIEWDHAACATREKVGLRTVQADVSALMPATFAPVKLVIASPPCPTFSKAGLREGIADLERVWIAAKAIVAGEPMPELHWRDARSALVVEPLRWALQLEPTYCAWEQVPEILPFWQFCAHELRQRGYSAWAGVLESECFGVAQTRSRAFLMASRAGHVEPPTPTHQRYVKGQGQREDVTLEGVVYPWVSMAEALGWGMTKRPAGTVVTPRGGGAETSALDGGSHQRSVMRDARESGEWVETDNVTREGTEKYRRPVDAPAPTLTSRADLWTLRIGNQERATERDVNEPAPTLLFGHRANSVEWTTKRPSPTLTGGSARAEGGILLYPHWRGEDPPPDWMSERPSTTVACDDRVSQPGHHDGRPGSGYPRQQDNAVKVTQEEAAVLQSFPPDYPFQGNKGKRFEQIGNAVPPLLARAVLAKLIGISA